MANQKLLLNGVEVDLYDSEPVVMDYGICDIGELESRNSAHSYTFSIPKTAKNRAALSNIDDISNLSQLPFINIPARLYEDGIDMGVSFARLRKVTSEYELNLYGTGNGDFFDWLKSTQFKDLNICALNHLWNHSNIVASRTNTSWYIYPIICYHSDYFNSFISEGTRSFRTDFAYPAIFFDSLLEYIVDAYGGYTLDNRLLEHPVYSTAKLLLAYSGESISQSGDLSYYKGKFTTTIDEAPQFVTSTEFSFALNLIEQDCDYWQYITTQLDTNFNFQTGALVSGNLHLILENSEAVPLTATITWICGSVTIYEKVITIPIGTTTFDESFTTLEIPIQDVIIYDNVISFTLKNVSVATANVTIKAGTYIEFTNVESKTAQELSYRTSPVYPYMTPNSIFGSVTLGDIVGNYLKMFAAIISVNDNTKTVTIFSFNDIRNNIHNAVDWSDKLDMSEVETIDFDSGYSQVTELSYKKSNKDTNPNTNATLNVDSTETDVKKIEVKFEATQAANMLNQLYTPVIPVVEEGERKNKNDLRVLLLKQTDVADMPDPLDDFVYTDGTSTTAVTTSVPLCRFIDETESYNLGFGNSLVNDYWGAVIDILNGFRKITAKFRLTPADINQLDFTKPVYVKYFNSWFYINKVSEYSTSGESTECELVKLF